MAHASVEPRRSQRVEPERNPAAGRSSLRSFQVMRELQLTKIREIRDALAATGYRHLDGQADVLGLPRSTTWSILQAKHKRTGLSAAVIKQMLDQPRLPPLVRSRIVEYVDEKSSGTYGHTRDQRRRFSTTLGALMPKADQPDRRAKFPTGEHRS